MSTDSFNSKWINEKLIIIREKEPAIKLNSIINQDSNKSQIIISLFQFQI